MGRDAVEGPDLAAGGMYADAGAAADELHAECGGGPGWCVGTAADPWHELVGVRGVSVVGGRHAVVRCADAGVALGAARLLRDEHGYERAGRERGADRVYLFAYALDAGQGG